MKIVSNCSLTTSFYIKRVGNCGEPSLTPLTANNSFGVVSIAPEIDFQRVAAAYRAGAFKPLQRGSVQQFITKKDVELVLKQCIKLDAKKLEKLAKLQKLVELEEQKLKSLKQLVKAHQIDVFYN